MLEFNNVELEKDIKPEISLVVREKATKIELNSVASQK